MFDFEYQLKVLPEKPGVYIMKNINGAVIYVGKAKILKNRVRQYFQNARTQPEKVRAMIQNISEFEYIVTDTEMEALILECNFIKKFRPRYNILLKDDKHYPFIKITVNEEFPRIYITRVLSKDGAKYFGPFTDASAVHETMELILPSGARVGHRSLMRYYKQRFGLPRAVTVARNQKAVGRVLQQYRALGWMGSTGAALMRERDMQYVQRMKSKWMLKIGMKNNATKQMHFRAQVRF